MMQRVPLTSSKVASIMLNKTACQRSNASCTLQLETPTFALPLTSARTIYSTRSNWVSRAKYLEMLKTPSLLQRIKNKIRLPKIATYRIKANAALFYENMVDNLDYSKFYKEFNMPDTMFSWFMVTELHLWMVMLRVMAEGQDGKTYRDTLVETLWNDVTTRMSKLGHIRSSVKKKQLTLLSQQFQAAIVNYDEGIMSDDKVLAAALWRRFFGLECNNPEHLEKLLIYVRKQVTLMEAISSNEVTKMRQYKWTDLTDV